jgi:hypothetical protein
MSYQLEIERHPTYLHARVTGQNSADTVIQYMSDIKAECEKESCFCVLVEEKLEGKRLDEMEVFSLISQGSADALGFFEALAYIDARQEFEIAKFAESVAVNRGIPIAIFSSVEDAKNWLRHRSEGSDEQKFFVDGDGSDTD